MNEWIVKSILFKRYITTFKCIYIYIYHRHPRQGHSNEMTNYAKIQNKEEELENKQDK